MLLRARVVIFADEHARRDARGVLAGGVIASRASLARMRTPRKFPKTRARPSRIRTRCPEPVGSSPAARSDPPVHATHAFDATRSFAAHRVAAHAVSWPVGSSPAARVSPDAHATHAFDATRSFAAHRATAHAVSEPVGSSPAARVSPDAHATHAFDATRSFAAHRAAAHAVSEPVGSSPAARVSPDAHATQVRRHALVRRASARGVLAGGVIASRAE